MAHHDKVLAEVQTIQEALERIKEILAPPPPPPTPAAAIDPVEGPEGTIVAVVGSGFPPSTPIHIRFNSLGRGAPRADEQGNLTSSITVPEMPPGEYPVTFVIRDETEPAVTLMFKVTPAPAGELVKDLKVSTEKDYQLGVLDDGQKVYIDREKFVFQRVPEALKGLTFIRTANDDKQVQVENYLTFTLTREAEVLVAYDERVDDDKLPQWLQDWTDTRLIIGTTDNNTKRRVFAKAYPPGEVVLGGAGAPPNFWVGSNYSVILREG